MILIMSGMLMEHVSKKDFAKPSEELSIRIDCDKKQEVKEGEEKIEIEKEDKETDF